MNSALRLQVSGLWSDSEPAIPSDAITHTLTLKINFKFESTSSSPAAASTDRLTFELAPAHCPL